MSDVINAVKRLERAGAENSRTTQKLYQAARTLAAVVEDIAPTEVWLPRQYKVIVHKTNAGSAKFLVKPNHEYVEDYDYIDGIGAYLHRDFGHWIPAQKRPVVLQFAQDVASGWIEELANFLEIRAGYNQEQAEVLENAAVAK